MSTDIYVEKPSAPLGTEADDDNDRDCDHACDQSQRETVIAVIRHGDLSLERAVGGGLRLQSAAASRACQIRTAKRAAPITSPSEPMIVGSTGPPVRVKTRPISVIGVAITKIQN